MTRDELSEARKKILGYKLGEPKTYTPTHVFPVVSRLGAPNPLKPAYYNWKPAEPKSVPKPRVKRAKRSKTKTVHAKTVRVCECGATISPKANRCVSCSIKHRTGTNRVCPKCLGPKDYRAKHCSKCQTPRPINMARLTCPICGGTKAKESKQCMQCRYPKITCACGKPALAKGLCNTCYHRQARQKKAV